jgi:hypothetical protein
MISWLFQALIALVCFALILGAIFAVIIAIIFIGQIIYDIIIGFALYRRGSGGGRK